MRLVIKYTISKDKVIEAICTEPLENGAFFSGYDVDDGKCTVCAVGAILRNTKSRLFDMNSAISVTQSMIGPSSLSNAYESGNFLSILSCEYEDFCSEDMQDKKDEQRFHALMVAEAFCPDVLEFEV